MQSNAVTVQKHSAWECLHAQNAFIQPPHFENNFLKKLK